MLRVGAFSESVSDDFGLAQCGETRIRMRAARIFVFARVGRAASGTRRWNELRYGTMPRACRPLRGGQQSLPRLIRTEASRHNEGILDDGIVENAQALQERGA